LKPPRAAFFVYVMRKYLIAGLGNLEDEYAGTRHNIGFDIVNALAKKHEESFELKRLAHVVYFTLKGRSITLIKPTTYMNLSGKAVFYWLNQIEPDDFIVVYDDVALPLGKIRLRKKGSSGGHNGLENIIEWLGSEDFNRLRFGIGQEFEKGKQVEYVLGKWTEEERKILEVRIPIAVEALEAWILEGMDAAMNKFNKI